MKDNLIIIYEGFIEVWRSCNWFGKIFHCIISPIWIFFALIITPLEFIGEKMGYAMDALQKLGTKK